MFCRNCGSSMNNMAAVCVKCGVATGNGINFCGHCGSQSLPGAPVCMHCGVAFVQPAYYANQKSKLVAGLLGVFLGAWGVHSFYLGKSGRGVLQIILTIVTCGFAAIWGFIEGILILCGKINTDADGVPLSDR